MKATIRTFKNDFTVVFEMYAFDQLEIETVTIHGLSGDTVINYEELTDSRKQFFHDAVYDKAYGMFMQDRNEAIAEYQIDKGRERDEYGQKRWDDTHIQ
jgi:hypothetical protein